MKAYMWNLENGTDEPICRAAIEMQMQRKDMWTQRGKRRVGQMGRLRLAYTCYHV